MAPRPEPERNGIGGSDQEESSSLTEYAFSEELNASQGAKNCEISSKPRSDDNGEPSSSSSEVMVPPDGGWGWAVLLGTMTVNIVVVGHAKSFGVYVKSLMEEFDASPSKVAWIQSLQICMFSFLSPVASVLSQVLGPRKVALVGGVLAFVGLTLSALSPNIEFLYISYGVVQGVALTFTFTPGISMIAKYFYQRRGLANGLAIAGNAMGGIVIPLVANKLITHYDLHGCLLIMASILLHACAGAMLWQPVEWHQKKQSSQEISKVKTANESDTSVGASPCTDTYPRMQSPSRSQSILSEDMTLTRKVSNGKRYSLYVSGPDLHTKSSDSVEECFLGGKINRGGSSPHLGEFLKNDHRHDESSVSTESLPLAQKRSPRLIRLKTSSRTSSFIYLSSYNLGPSAGAVLTKEHFLERDHRCVTPPEAILPEGSKVKKPKTWFLSSFIKHIRIDKSIFQNSRLYIMTVSLFFHVLGYPGTQIFLPYRATMLGLSESHAASLLSVLSLTDLTGRICCAWISDFHFCPRKYLFICGMLMSGVFAFSLPFYTTYGSLLAGTAGFGFACGSYIGLVVVLFADAYGPEKVALAYSFSTVSGGFMALGGPPIMGYVLESTGSYLVCQSILGSAQFVGAAVWIVEPWALRWEKRKREKRENVAQETEGLV